MEDGFDRERIGLETDGPERGRSWWMSVRTRLPLMLVCLAAAVFALVRADGGVLSRASGKSAPCPPRTPALAEVSIGGLVSLHDELRRAIAAVAARPATVGVVHPEVAWSDNPPATVRASRLPGGRWPASWEMREYLSSSGNHEAILGDVFYFASAAVAHEFLQRAASRACHRSAIAVAAPFPAAARNLVWINPDDVLEEDVYTQQGPLVFRIGSVRTKGPPAVQDSAGLARVDRLACALSSAVCPRSRA
jgi:hypothetical protein